MSESAENTYKIDDPYAAMAWIMSSKSVKKGMARGRSLKELDARAIKVLQEKLGSERAAEIAHRYRLPVDTGTGREAGAS